MNRKCVSAAVLIVAVLCGGGTLVHSQQRPVSAVPARDAAPIDSRLSDAVMRGDVPGVVAMAVTRGGVIYQGAFGLADAAARRPLAVDAIFRIASMTKPVTSVAAMQLVEQHRLALDDPAQKYLPEFTDLKVIETFDAATGAYTVRPATKAVTVRHLLTHTSGLGYGFTSAIVRDFKPTAGERFAVGPLLFEPGTQWIYGTGIDWAGKIVEKISGQPLDQYFREHIFRPLGMADTDFTVADDKAARVGPVHRRRADGTFETTGNQLRAPVNGGGGLFSTARDYATFMQMILNGGTLAGARLLSAASVRAMGENQIGAVGVRAIKTAQPDFSSDFTFVDDGRDKWSIGFLISTAGEKGKRSPGSLSWGGIDNTYFWIDQRRGIAGVILMQFLPFADAKALAIYDGFERGVYQLSATSSR
jgi:CubicO group peptidase (beta-lactamase class C family)